MSQVLFMLLQTAEFPSFSWLNNILLYIHIYLIVIIYLFIDGHLGCFCILAIVNNATINMGLHESLWYPIFITFEYIFRIRITRSLLYFFFFFVFFRATPVAHGSSQARCQIRAVAARLYHSHGNVRSEPWLGPTPQLVERQILNPLSEARDRAHILMDTTWVCNPLSHKGNSA